MFQIRELEMSILSPHLAVAFLGTLVLGSCEANIWAAFMGNHSHQAAPPVEPGLCSSLVSKMEILNKGTPGTCKPMPDNVSGMVYFQCIVSVGLNLYPPKFLSLFIVPYFQVRWNSSAQRLLLKLPMGVMTQPVLGKHCRYAIKQSLLYPISFIDHYQLSECGGLRAVNWMPVSRLSWCVRQSVDHVEAGMWRILQQSADGWTETEGQEWSNLHI